MSVLYQKGDRVQEAIAACQEFLGLHPDHGDVDWVN